MIKLYQSFRCDLAFLLRPMDCLWSVFLTRSILSRSTVPTKEIPPNSSTHAPTLMAVVRDDEDLRVLKSGTTTTVG